jgi:hypothetical protein
MADPLTIRQILDSILKGAVRIPAFQRGFVWDPETVAYFMDSLYKGYPFGSLLFWRTRAQLTVEKKLGPFVLPERDPDYPIDYVLDGQQRITSIFGVFQTELIPAEPPDWTKVYFDFRLDPSAQESQFFVLSDNEIDLTRYFPLNSLFNTIAYRKATSTLPEETIKIIDQLQERFKEIRVPVQTFTTEDRATVAIVFERVNRKGVPLDTLQLLSAWTWSDEFDLQRAFGSLQSELEPFGFDEVGMDVNLLLRCCAAVLAGDASPETLVELSGAMVRERFAEVTNGIKGAIDFLRVNLQVYSLDNLPFQTLLVPLSVFFAKPGNQNVNITNNQRERIVKWFWKACFSRRYSGGVLRNLKTDIEEMVKLRDGELTKLDTFNVKIDADFFTANSFKIDSVNTKVLVLLLANHSPLSFISGQPINLDSVLRDYNRNEFHHIFPRSYLRDLAISDANRLGGYDPNCLANFCFMSRSDNNQLGGVAPSIYRSKMPQHSSAILDRAFAPSCLFTDEFPTFVKERAALLSAEAIRVMS